MFFNYSILLQEHDNIKQTDDLYIYVFRYKKVLQARYDGLEKENKTLQERYV